MFDLVGHTARLSIGGTSFEIVSPELPLCRRREKTYAPFRLADGEEDDGVGVRLTLASPPSMEGLPPLFRGGDAWALFGDGATRLAVSPPPGRGKAPHWTARIDCRGRTIEVFCGPGLLREVRGRRAVEDPVRYPLDQILTMYLLGGDGVVAHAAGAVRDGRGRIFAGPSGAGKTTVARRLQEEGDEELLSDDRVILRRHGGGFVVCGTPWPGEAGAASSASAPLEGIFVLKKAESDGRRKLAAGEALEKLLPVLSLPWYDPDLLDEPLVFCSEMLSRVPVFELTFTKMGLKGKVAKTSIFF